MSVPDPKARVAELRAEHNRLSNVVTLQHKRTDIESLEDDLNRLSQTVQKLGQAGYAGVAHLNAHLKSLTDSFHTMRGQFTHAHSTASARLQTELAQTDVLVNTALGGRDALADSALATLKTFVTRVELAERQLDSLLRPFQDARYTWSSLFNTLSWTMEAWEEFSGDRNAYGKLLIAAEAEWKQSGRGGDDPDGVLYLTDTALVFEQKEKKGKTLGLFGGKVVQEIEFSIPLSQISDVRSKNEGMFGGRDILFITVNSGDPAPEVKIEVKGSADNKIWAGYILTAKQGGDVFDAPVVTIPAVDLSVWSGALPPAPVVPVDMAAVGGILAGMMSKANEPDEQPASAMKGMAQKLSKADDDDDDKKDAPKGGQKPMGGGRKDD